MLPASVPAAFPGDNGKILFDRQGDIYTINPDWTGETNLTSLDPANNSQGAWSADGRKIVFVRQMVAGGSEIAVMNADGTGLTQLTATEGNSGPTWSPDGSKVAFNRGNSIYVMNADGSNRTYIGEGEEPDWSPDGTKIAFSVYDPFNPYSPFLHGPIHTMNPDGSDARPVTNPASEPCSSGYAEHYSPDWSPDSRTIAYVKHDEMDDCWEGEAWEVWAADPDTPGSARRMAWSSDGLFSYVVRSPIWSPDGRQFAYVADELHIQNATYGGSSPPSSPPGEYGSPDWQPLTPPGYARPKGATPNRVTLVPAYEPCASANAAHGPPLATGSCSPAAAASDYLTIGSPEANEAAAKSTGFVHVGTFCSPPTSRPFPPCTDPGDQIDADLIASMTDVRNNSSLTDYSGELRVSMTLRITDRSNGAGNVHPGTVLDTPITFNMSCVSTSDGTVGSTCSAHTSADALLPGIALEGKRAVWGLGPVRVYDGGADGDADTTGDNTLFMEQGLFLP